MSEKQSGIEGPNWATAYHYDFAHPNKEFAAKYPHDEGKGEDEAPAAFMVELRAGRAALPAGANCIFDLEPAPRGCEQTHYWPTWDVRAKDESGAVRIEGSLSNENPAIDGFVGIQSPKSPDSPWTKSSGYRMVCGFDKLPFKASIEMRGRVGEFSTEWSVVIPWVAQG